MTFIFMRVTGLHIIIDAVKYEMYRDWSWTMYCCTGL